MIVVGISALPGALHRRVTRDENGRLFPIIGDCTHGHRYLEGNKVYVRNVLFILVPSVIP